MLALQNFTGQIKYHYPRHPIIKFTKNMELVFPIWLSTKPLDQAVTIFTDDSSSE